MIDVDLHISCGSQLGFSLLLFHLTLTNDLQQIENPTEQYLWQERSNPPLTPPTSTLSSTMVGVSLTQSSFCPPIVLEWMVN